jgi:hypothetical protein
MRAHCAPGMVAEGARLHMYLQQEFNELGGHIEHLVSDDDGRSFRCPAVSPPAFDRGGSGRDHREHPSRSWWWHQSPRRYSCHFAPTVCILRSGSLRCEPLAPGGGVERSLPPPLRAPPSSTSTCQPSGSSTSRRRQRHRGSLKKLVQKCSSAPGRVKLLVPRFHVAPALIA